MRSVLIAITKTAVTALLFYFLFRKVNFQEFFETLKHARLDVLMAGFLVLWIGHYICIFRWRMLMRPLMPVLSISHLLAIYCIGLFFNLAFPTAVGGDVVKMYYAGKPSRRFAQSFAATFLDRDAGMLAMMIIASAATIIHPVRLEQIPVSLTVWCASAAFIVVNIAIFMPSWHRLLTGLLIQVHLARLARKIDTISSVFQVIGKHRGILANSLAISLVNQALVISVTWIMAIGFNIEVSPHFFLIFVPIITLISMIPLSLNGMGLREYAFLSLFGAIGVDRESCIALGLLSSIITVLSAIPGGVVYIFFKNRSDAQGIAALETEFS